MTGTFDLLEDVITPTEVENDASSRPCKIAEAHECDGCGEVRIVDVWAEDYETGERILLCEACGDG